MSALRIYSFSPIARSDARVLILGSMPGKASLAAHQYYAHPRNLFWKIMGELVGAGPEVPYAQRVQILQDQHIALWDVLQSCTRESSLDTDIKCEVANDFPAFFLAHPQITHVFFNGGKAESAFRKYVKICSENLIFTRLPSTSPAHASLSFEKKLAAWLRVKV
jgi:TDG/mug DNA glycosylase family protein